MSTALVRPVSSVVWELRTAWAIGRRVALSLDERCEPPRVEGWVAQVAASGMFVKVGATHVPSDAILAVHLPSRLGDSTIRSGEAFHGLGRRVEQPPGQQELVMA